MNKFKRIYYELAKLWCSGEKYARTINVKRAKEQGVILGENCRIYSASFSTEQFLIELGNNVTVTSGVRFITHDGAVHVIRQVHKKYENADIYGKIKIGNNVFIGFNSIIMPGVEIGDNTVVAAGSIVTKSFREGNVIIGGTPAKKIKDLNDYILLNERYIVNTKGLNNQEKKLYIRNMNREQLITK